MTTLTSSLSNTGVNAAPNADQNTGPNTTPNAASDRVRVSRAVERRVDGIATSDGDGVRLTRVLTQSLQRRLDPFLMLDAFRSDNPNDYIGSFPNHPHRGFETVTYMIAGRMRHRDSAGHEGLLQNGGVQWMTAGSGLVHSELPEQEDGLMEGFQLWLNLPAANKMVAPSYRDIPAAAVPEFVTAQGVTVRVIAGGSHGHVGAVRRPDTTPLYLDVHLPAGSRFEQPIDPGFNAFVYVYRGAVTVGGAAGGAGGGALGGDKAGDAAGNEVGDRQMAILANDPSADGVTLTTDTDSRVLIIAGQPLREPIAQYGPFVMNNRQQLEQALADFRDGKFEAAQVQALQGS